jgi:hypothetical protein
MFSDAEIYCVSVGNSINTQLLLNDELRAELNSKINAIKSNTSFMDLSFAEVVKVVEGLTRKELDLTENNFTDAEIVARHLGKLCYCFKSVCPSTQGKFDLLFIEVWKNLFKEQDEKKAIKEVLKKSLSNFKNRNTSLTPSDLEEEVINNACKYIFENFKGDIKSVHDINLIGSVLSDNLQYKIVADTFVEVANEMFPEHYKDEEMNYARKFIIVNISWAGMWDHLRNYFQQKHGIKIDSVDTDPNIFYSKHHKRFESGSLVNEINVERNININFLDGKKEISISIEPTLSTKTAQLIQCENKILVYKGHDPDYLFRVTMDKYNGIEKFELELPNRRLKIIYT